MAKELGFANRAFINVDESGANTLTFQQLETGVPLFEKRAWVIHRLTYQVQAADFNLMVATDDTIQLALTTNNTITSLWMNQPAVLDRLYLGHKMVGAVVSDQMIEGDWIHDFSDLPGGGLIVPPTNLYLGVLGGSLATPISDAHLVIYYTEKQLKPAEYWELVESTRIISS